MFKNNSVNKQELSFKKIRKSIITSFTLAFIFALFLVIGINFTMTHGGYDVKIIDLSGNQKMLSQKIAKQIYKLQIDGTVSNELRQDIELWKRTHLSLRFGDVALEIPGPTNTVVDSILKDITYYQQQLYFLSKKVDLSKLNVQELQLVGEWESNYLLGMDDVVRILEKEHKQKISNLQYIISLLTILFIVFIWLLYKLYVKGIIESVRILSKEKEIQSDHMSAILESTKNQIWTLDWNYRLISHNSAFIDHRIATSGNVPKIGENLINLDSHYDYQAKEYYDQALSGKSFVIETDLELNNEIFYYELSFNPIKDENNQVNGCSVNQREVTHRVKTLIKLKENESSLLEAQRIAKIGNWEWDIKNNKIKWSAQLYNLFDKDPQCFEPTYETVMALMYPEDRINFEIDFRNSFNHQEYIDTSSRIIFTDGSIKHMRHIGKLHYNENNVLIHMSGTTQDITLMEKSKQRILQQYRELQNFVYIISHNVRGPISTLLSLLQMYDQNSKMDKDEIIGLINLTVDKLDGTIKDLNHSLSLKNISQSDMEKIELRDIIEDVLVLISSEIKKCNATINLNLASAKHVFGLRSYYSSIFYNLILNSLKFKSTDRPLQIDITSNPNSIGGVEVIISDNGLGMDLTDDRRKRIFDMYGRLSGSTNGKGLGLYLIKTKVEAMGGSIDVKSKIDKGSSFTLNVLANL